MNSENLVVGEQSSPRKHKYDKGRVESPHGPLSSQNDLWREFHMVS